MALGFALFATGASLIGLGLYSLFSQPNGVENPFAFLRDARIVLRQNDEATDQNVASRFRYIDLPFADMNLPVTTYYYLPPPGQPFDLFPEQVVVGDMQIIIEALQINAPVITLGLDSNAVPAVPLTGYQVAWYNFSAEPGSGSNAVFSGHVTWARERAIFWSLKDLQPGDDVKIITKEGKEYVYEVFANFAVDPNDPDALQVMQSTKEEIITLITCGGRWLPNPSERFGGSYSQRVIVQARLVSSGVAEVIGGG